MINLIIAADDFGYSPVYNKTMLELASHGYLSAVSIMVNNLDQEFIARQARELVTWREKQNTSIGLHFVFDHHEAIAPLDDQWDRFVEFFKFQPDFMDMHKPDSYPNKLDQLTEFCRIHNVPCRNYGQTVSGIRTTDEEVLPGTINFGPIMDFTDIIEWIKLLKQNKFYEIQFHPGKFDPQTRSSINIARELDTENVIRLNGLLMDYDIKLINYQDLPEQP